VAIPHEAAAAKGPEEDEWDWFGLRIALGPCPVSGHSFSMKTPGKSHRCYTKKVEALAAVPFVWL
jgi:hypothetical protein